MNRAERLRFMAECAAELEAQIKHPESAQMGWEEAERLREERTALEFKAKAYDAMCDVGLIQFGDDPETRCYSVWGFGAWHHDPDILKAIAAAMDAPILIGEEPAPSSPTDVESEDA